MKGRMFSMLFVLIFISQFLNGQNLISGNVIRETKKPLPGVKITIEGVPGVEAFTDQLGNFDIEVPITAKILIFSFNGMKTQKIGIGKKSFISITMIEGKDEVPPPVVKKEEKPKDSAKVKSKEAQDTATTSKKPKESKPKNNSKEKSTKDKKSTSDPSLTTEPETKEPAKTESDSKKSKKSK